VTEEVDVVCLYKDDSKVPTRAVESLIFYALTHCVNFFNTC